MQCTAPVRSTVGVVASLIVVFAITAGFTSVAIPVAVSVFPGEPYEAPRSWTEGAYPKLIYYNKFDKGGHFAAWEEPQLFSEELRAAFRSIRDAH